MASGGGLPFECGALTRADKMSPPYIAASLHPASARVQRMWPKTGQDCHGSNSIVDQGGRDAATGCICKCA